MLPAIPTQVNKLIQDQQGNISTYPFPLNIAEDLPIETRQAIMRWMLKTYIWPQIMERRPYENQWNKLLDMARAAWKISNANIDPGTRLESQRREAILSGDAEDDSPVPLSNRLKISDTVIFDAVDRLTNLNHFIAFKEELPVQYEIPPDMIFPYENDVYSPTSDLVRSANCWLKFNARNENFYRKYWMTSRHHYTYGLSFADSQFVQKIEPMMRRDPANPKKFVEKLELTKIGITFEPMSIRKLWLNVRLNPYQMDYQPCPFFFTEMPRFATVANPYNPDLNPFGYVNLSSLPKAQYLFSNQETASMEDAFRSVYPDQTIDLSNLTPPEFNVELLWTFYPMLPLDPETLEFDENGDLGIPLKRYIMETFGNNLCNGQQEIIRLQRNFYPHDSLPLYGSAHMPSLDDGVYSPAIGSILEPHYIQICKALNQFLENKDWINDPPMEITHTSPALAKSSEEINGRGMKIPVLTQNDIKRREPFDATQTTPQFLEMAREKAQTSSKTVDAILGKAMGSRTSATEASNIFQTSMSGVTTDVNLFSHDIAGSYATKVWEYTGLWVDPDVLAEITGSYGFKIKPEHFSIRLGIKFDIGSVYMESITRQGNIRYLLETTQPGDPAINRPYLLKELLKEWKFKNIDQIVNDQGLEDAIQIATQQAIETFLGGFVLIDPKQNHEVAIRVKTSFLTDRNSVWNTSPEYVRNGPLLVNQIQQHQYWIQLQMLQQMIAMQQQMGLQSLQSGQGGAGAGSSQMPGMVPFPSPPSVPSMSGQLNQGMM